MSEIEQLIKVVDQQKGELLYLQTLIIALMRSMPEESQATVYQNFLKAADSSRNAALFSEASEDVIFAFEHYCEALSRQASKRS